MLTRIFFADGGGGHPLRCAWFALAACLVTGCGESNDASKSSGQDSKRAAPFKNDSVTLYTWDEYFDPEVLRAFSEKTGIAVNLETFEDTDGVVVAIRDEPSRFDVIVIDGDSVEEMRELGLARELERAQLPQLVNIDPKYLNLDVDPGNKYSVPYLWGTTLLAYRKDMIPEPGDSWSLLWDQRYRGKVAMLDERLESFSIALFKNGYSLNDREPAAIEAAESDLLDQIKDMNVQYVEGVPSAIEEGLGSGEIWAMVAYSGDAAMVADEDERVGLMLPKEGAALWVDNFVITRHSRRSAEAHAFIDFMLTPEIAAKNANYLHYATPNRNALEYLDQDLRDNKNIFPSQEVLQRCEFYGSLTPERERPVNAVWQRVMSAYQRSKESPFPEGTEITEIIPLDD